MEVIVADKGYDSEHIREQITKKGARIVIPRKRNLLKGNAIWTGVCISAFGGKCLCAAKAVATHDTTN